MLPINNKAAKGCTPISSSCVIWNGPDLPCIDLCKGDNIDTVIYEIATELCNLLDLVDLQNYENIPENINDAQDLIQALINSLSNEVECCDNETPASEQIITMASCFWYTNNTNDTVTTATLEEYTRMIGARLCDLVTTVNNNTTAIQQLSDQVNQNTANYQELTDDIATGALMPQFASRTSGETGTTNDGLRALENSYLNLKDATGSADALYKAALAAGSNLNTENRLDGQGKMNSILGWVDSVSSLADSVNNLWLTVLDARKGLNALSCTNNVIAECRDISLKFRADISADLQTIKIYLDGSTIPSGFRDCDTTGSSLELKDMLGNCTTVKIPIIATEANPKGAYVDVSSTMLDVTGDITATLTACLYNPTTGITCEKDYTYLIATDLTCPSLTIIPTQTDVTITVNPTTSGLSYIINIYEYGAADPIQSRTLVSSGSPFVELFNNLDSATSYEVNVEVVRTAADNKVCPRSQFNTIPAVCLPAIGVTAGVALIP